MLTSLTYANADGTRKAIVERNDSGEALFRWSVTRRDHHLRYQPYRMGSLHDCQRIARQWVQTGQVTR